MNWFQKTSTLLSNPGMPARWLQWMARHFGFRPRLAQPLGGHISGFRCFSEFWGAKKDGILLQEIEFIRKHAGHSGVILDVGANLGAFALTLSRCRPGLKVHAFEPSPHTHAILRKNLSANAAGDITAHQLAVGSANGGAAFRDDPKSAPTNRIIQSPSAASSGNILVNVVALDDFLAEKGLQEVAFLKMDVEGHETEALLGCSKLFQERRCRAALIELSTENLIEAGSSAEKLLDVVQSLGCRLCCLNNDGTLGTTVSLQDVNELSPVNVALVPCDA